jgi:GTP-binding protein
MALMLFMTVVLFTILPTESFMVLPHITLPYQHNAAAAIKTATTSSMTSRSIQHSMVSSMLDEDSPLATKSSRRSTKSSSSSTSSSSSASTTTTTASILFANPSVIMNNRMKKEPLVAIIGRPNVGKSALVNRLSGIPQQHGGSIVADEPGITRDRTYKPAEFLGEAFSIIDTGGLVFDDTEGHLFAKEIRDQAMIAIQESSAVIFVVDGQTGLTSMDRSIGEFLRKEVLRHIPVHVAVNKCESSGVGGGAGADHPAAEFWNLGLGEPMPVSALHGVGTAELLEHVFASVVQRHTARPGFGTKVPELLAAKAAMKSKEPLPGEDATDFRLRTKYGIGDKAQQVLDRYEAALSAFDQDNPERPEEINVAIIGRPNVGKSSLLNAIFGETRAIVSDVAGTTRDSIDAIIERPAQQINNDVDDNNDNDEQTDGDKKIPLPTIYRFVDTAGIRRKSKVEYGPEMFMVNRALRAMRRADVGTCL